MNPRSLDERKNSFCVSSNKKIQDKVKPAHCVGHSRLGSIDRYNLFKRTLNFYENQSSVTGNT